MKPRPPGTTYAVRVSDQWADDEDPYAQLTGNPNRRFAGTRAKALAVKFEWRRCVSEDSFEPTSAKPSDIRLVAILPRVERKPREEEVADAVVKALEARIKSLEALVDELRRERDALMTERDRLSAAYESMRDKRDACVREDMEKATRMRVMR